MSPRSDQPRRRSFTAKDKRDILGEYAAADPAARGVLLRREGLYSLHLSEWRKAHNRRELAGLTPAAGPAEKSVEQVEGREEGAERELAKTTLRWDREKGTGALGGALRERGHRDAVEAVITPAVLLLAALT